MKIHQVELGRDLTHIYLLPVSDLHVGDYNFDAEKFFRYRQWILDTKNAYIILNGDIMNTATKSSVSDIYAETMNPKEALATAEKIFTPIKDRILAIVGGNHERRIYKDVGLDASEFLASKLGVLYAGDEVYLKIKFGKSRGHGTNGKPIVYTVYATHGFGAGRTIGSKVNSLHRLSEIVLADCYIFSHVHTMTAHQDIYKVPDIRANKLIDVKRTFASSGSFLKRGGYAVTHGYPHGKLGTVRIRLDGTRKDCHVSL